MVFGVFSPGRTQCIAPKKLPDKAMSIWNLHKKFQLSSAMGLRDFDLQSQPTLMGGEPINCRAMANGVSTIFFSTKEDNKSKTQCFITP